LHAIRAHCDGNFSQEVIAVKRIKSRVAVAATVVGLGGLAGVALNAGQQSASQPVAAKPLVRTKVIRRTVHVTKHAKPRHPAVTVPPAGASSASAPVTTRSSGGASEEPVTTSTSSTGTQEPVTTATSGAGEAPITTSTSGAGEGGGEERGVGYESAGEHEGGDD
jgi:hypothetical protein